MKWFYKFRETDFPDEIMGLGLDLPDGIPTELGHRYIFCSDVLYTRILFLTITQPNLLGKNAQSKDTRKLHNSSAAVTLSDRSQAAPTINSDSMHNIYYMHAHSDNQTGSNDRLNLCDKSILVSVPPPCYCSST